MVRNQAVDNLRGLCALGVLGIHIGGTFALEAASPSGVLYFVLEICSRYSIPTFFFISGFGLFRCYPLSAPLAAVDFWRRRLGGVAVPYLTWSCLYALYFTWTVPGYSPWHLAVLWQLLFYGLACYQLYFMVILLWFYLLLPLWRALLGAMTRVGLDRTFAALFVLQLAFNYWTCHPGVNADAWSPWLRDLFVYRLNYWPWHYLFVFMLGAAAAEQETRFFAFLQRHLRVLIIAFSASLLTLGAFSWYSAEHGYTLLALANTYHQLTWQGLLYTVATILLACAALGRMNLQGTPARVLNTLAAHSAFIYFVHPLFIDWVARVIDIQKITLTNGAVVVIYLLVLVLSLAAARGAQGLRRYVPRMVYLLTGRS